ncbi:sortase [Candidatus Peregrinibacteria bacterium]|nr:sortase [Candidatus Peregrinibacteria bacterium]
MISAHNHDHEAEYDEDGNIRLPDADNDINQNNSWTVTEEDSTPISNLEDQSIRVSRKQHGHNVPFEDEISPSLEKSFSVSKDHHIFISARKKIFNTINSVFSEGTNQYSSCLKTCKSECINVAKNSKSIKKPIWNFLTQPVWVVQKKKNEMKQYNRLTLFLIDTVRFGGTFAGLFLLLCITLNFQSFWKITKSNLNPIQKIQESSLLTGVDDTMKQKLLRSPSLAVSGDSNGNMLSFLPQVGPPTNRIIIPKLHLNVPLITPSYQSLLNEEWDELEEDIQDALQLGVVHYPGTARPGQAGNFFITGHSSYYPWAPGAYKSVFAGLHQLEPGDEYWIYYGGDKHRYIVQEKKEVKPTNVNVLDQPINKRIGTLMTCTPIGTTLRRLIITSQEVDPITSLPMDIGVKAERELPSLDVESLPI